MQRGRSDNGAVGYDAVLWHDHDSIAYVVILAFEIAMSRIVQNLDALTDSRVLVDNRAANKTIRADSDPRVASIYIRLQFFDRLIGICSHHQNAIEPRAVFDAASNANDRVGDGGAVDDAAFGDDRTLNMAIEQLRAGQITRPCVHRRFRIKKVERRQRQCHFDVRAIERANGSDVFPVAVEQVSLNVVARERLGDYLLAEVDSLGRVVQQ